MSAAARARRDKSQCERMPDIMPFIAVGLQRHTPTGLPLPGEIAANSKNCVQALGPQYDQTKVNARAFAPPGAGAQATPRSRLRLAAVMG
jgi:hypothetical protein